MEVATLREPSKEAIEAALDANFWGGNREDAIRMMERSIIAAYAIDLGPTSDTLLTTRHVKQLEAELQAAQIEVRQFHEYRKSGICSWCGLLFKAAGEDDVPEARAALLDHARNCKGHPAVSELQAAQEKVMQAQSGWRKAQDQWELALNLLAAAKERIAELESLKVHCPDCGADYAATGIEAGCPCKFVKRIAELEYELSLWREVG